MYGHNLKASKNKVTHSDSRVAVPLKCRKVGQKVTKFTPVNVHELDMLTKSLSMNFPLWLGMCEYFCVTLTLPLL